MPTMRLDKFISSQRPDISRSEVKTLLRRGYVTVDGSIAKSPEMKIDPEISEVKVGGSVVSYRKNLYIMLNKPAGVVCSTRDGLSETVIELLPEELRRQGLFPAGRLDKDTEGFVLITDDGDLAHRMLSPKSHVPKIYFVRLSKPLDGSEEKAFLGGMTIDGGDVCLPAELKPLERENECLVTLHEGMYHQVKRMFSCLGNEVAYLKRIQIGMVELDNALAPGEARELTENEAKSLLLAKKTAL